MSLPNGNNPGPPPEVIFSDEALRRAWRSVRRNGPSPGADGLTPRAFEQNLQAEIKRLQREVLNGSYKPVPVRRFATRKASGKERPLTIWALRDRVAQRVVLDYLTPRMEQLFLDCSYGFRPGRSPEDALRAVAIARDANRRWVVDADIENCFDSIPPALLMGHVRAVVVSPLVAHLIELWLATPVHARRREVAGVSQGSVISPLLANLYLHSFDWMVQASLPQVTLVRFADDFVILCRRKQEAKWALTVAGRSLANLRLRLNHDKTHITHFDEGFNFLGASFRGGTIVCPYPLSGLN